MKRVIVVLMVVASAWACSDGAGQGGGKYEQDCLDWYVANTPNTKDFSADICRGLYAQYGGNGGWKNSTTYQNG